MKKLIVCVLLIRSFLPGFLFSGSLLACVTDLYTRGTVSVTNALLVVAGCVYVYGAFRFVDQKKERLFDGLQTIDNRRKEWRQMNWLRSNRSPRH